MKEKLQQFGKAMLVPISLIALSGLFLGLGGALTTELTMTSLGVNWDWYSTSFLFDFFSVIKGLGSVIIGNLGPLYAVGVRFIIAKRKRMGSIFSTNLLFCNAKYYADLLNAKGWLLIIPCVDALDSFRIDSY